MTDLPMAGVRVLDRTRRLAGAYATKLLRDVGADVVITETRARPHRLRRMVAPGVVLPDGADAALFQWLQAGKRSVDMETATQLVDRADIVVDDGPDAAPTRAGAVGVSITDFGLHGPWAGRAASHLTLDAESGSLASRGIPALPDRNS